MCVVRNPRLVVACLKLFTDGVKQFVQHIRNFEEFSQTLIWLQFNYWLAGLEPRGGAERGQKSDSHMLKLFREAMGSE